MTRDPRPTGTPKKFELSKDKLVWLASAGWGISVVFAGLVFASPNPLVLSFGGLVIELFADDLIALAVIGSLVGPAAWFTAEGRRKNSIDNNIPVLLRDVAEAGNIGITLTRAIEVSAERDYGSLTRELRRIVGLLSWGVSLDRALESFTKRAGTRLAKQATFLLAEASRMGGDIQESIETVNQHVQEMQAQDRKRKSQMRPSIGVIYISFTVFIVTIFLLSTQFFDVAIGGFSSFSALSQSGEVVPKEALFQVFFYMGMVEAVFAGLAGGKMSTGTIKQGFTHAVVLASITFIIFNFVI